MIFNFVLGVYCFWCKKYCNPYTGIYLLTNDEQEGSVNCLMCNHILGYTWDISWVKFWED